jgi:hypothetical protein
MVNSFSDISSKVIFSLFSELFTLILADKFSDLPPVPLAGSFVRQSLTGCQQSAHTGRFLTQLHGFLGFLIQQSCLDRRTPTRGKTKNGYGKLNLTTPDPQDITNLHNPRRSGSIAIHLHFTAANRLCSQASGLEKSGSPEPLVNPHLQVCLCHFSHPSRTQHCHYWALNSPITKKKFTPNQWETHEKRHFSFLSRCKKTT